jgi:hypothetical protein
MNKRELIENIQREYNQEDIITIVTELLTNLDLRTTEDTQREAENNINDERPAVQRDRRNRIIYIGDRVQAQTPVRGQYPRGRVSGFVTRILQGRPQVYVRFESENNAIHHRLGRNLLKE